MKAIKNVLALLMAVAMLAGVLAGCGGGGTVDVDWDGTPQYGGHLNARNVGRPTGVDPLKQTGAWKYQWTTPVYEPFLSRDVANKITPCVCDFQLSEDLLSLQVWPREGYIFSHDYGQVELGDLEASWNRGLTQYANIKKYVAPYVASAQIETMEVQGELDDAPTSREVFNIQFKEYNEKCLYYFAAYRTWWPVMPKEICEKYASSYIIDQLEDAVGTGPYIYTEFKDSVQVTLTKRDDYVPVDNSQYTGFAGTKYGYMDTMTFHYNPTDSSAATAVLAGDYDCTEVIPTEYAQMAENAGIILSALPSDQRCWIKFNTVGTNNLVSKYPSLRKAIMAAIDYTTFLDLVTDSSMIMDDDNIMMEERYNTTQMWKDADYYGDFNQAAVDKYMAAAKAEGYNGTDPLQVTYHTGRNDIPTMLCDAMDNAGINYKLTTMEHTTWNSFVGDPSNNWDFYFSWIVTAPSPSLLQDSVAENDYKSETKDTLRAQMWKLDPASDEYLELWKQWSADWVENCEIGYMSAIDWWWWHPKTLHINDDAENGNTGRYMYNAFWEDPVNHPKR